MFPASSGQPGCSQPRLLPAAPAVIALLRPPPRPGQVKHFRRDHRVHDVNVTTSPFGGPFEKLAAVAAHIASWAAAWWILGLVALVGVIRLLCEWQRRITLVTIVWHAPGGQWWFRSGAWEARPCGCKWGTAGPGRQNRAWESPGRVAGEPARGATERAWPASGERPGRGSCHGPGARPHLVRAGVPAHR